MVDHIQVDRQYMIKSLPKSIENFKISESVSGVRPEIEKKIQNIYSKNLGKYSISYGPKGVGKSELIDHFAIGKTCRN